MLCISVHSRVAGPACFGMYTHAESGRQTIVHFLRRSRVIIAIYSIRYMSPWHDLVVLSECFGCIRSCFETLDRVPSHCPYKRKRKKKKCSALPSVIIQWFSYAFFSFIESIRIEKCRWSIETRYQCVLYATVNSRLIDSRSRSSRNAKVNTVGANACMYIAGRWLNFVFIGFSWSLFIWQLSWCSLRILSRRRPHSRLLFKVRL